MVPLELVGNLATRLHHLVNLHVQSIITSNIISLSITNRHSPTRKVFIIVVWRQMPKLTALLQCCIATSLHPKSVQTESTLRYFAASLQSMPGWKQDTYQSMPAWTQDPSRCFVASLQSYIRCQSELKAASAASLLRYNLCQPENKNLTLLRLRREVRLQERVWNDIMAFFVVLDSFELQMMAELIKRGRNDKMWRVVRLPFFGEWPPDDVFSFRCRSGVKGGRRNERKKWDAFL